MLRGVMWCLMVMMMVRNIGYSFEVYLCWPFFISSSGDNSNVDTVMMVRVEHITHKMHQHLEFRNEYW